MHGDAHERHARFAWLTPPDFTDSPTLADVVAGVTPQVRTAQAIVYIQTVWALWAQPHRATLTDWCNRVVKESSDR